MLSFETIFCSAGMFLGSVCLLGSSPVSADSFTSESETYGSGLTETSVEMVRLRSEGLDVPVSRIKLEPLEADVAGDDQVEPRIGPRRIGVGRDLHAPFNKAHNGSVLKWIELENGDRAARLELESPGARGLRVGLLIYALPAKLELRFYSPGEDSAPMHEVTGSEINAFLARQHASRDADDKDPVVYWSPASVGEALGIEFLLPRGIEPSEIRLAIAKISHFHDTLYQAVSEVNAGVGASLGCHLDVACYLESWGEVARSVARIVFTTTDGFTALCSGTLVSDLDPESQIAYFLTANHCVPNQTVASSVQTHWFFRSQGCRQDAPDRIVTRGGGATLLGTFEHPDISLLRLDRPPPNGALMAGWDASPLELRRSVTGIHHPKGDLKKISFGRIESLGFCNIDQELGFGYCGELEDAEGKYYMVDYSQGLVEPGSSGSAILVDSSQKLVGVLSAGPSVDECGAEPTYYYSRFDLAFQNKFFKWLGVSNACDAEPGSWAFCSNPACGPCAAGEGDCDNDTQCQDGLVCAKDIGEAHGFDALTDVCVVPASPETPAVCERQQGDWGYCADPACGPCLAGAGDCDADSECVGALVCRSRVGAEYGLASDVDVCDRIPGAECKFENGDWRYCGDPDCGPCAAGQGDCDSDADCHEGLICSFNAGAKYGLPAKLDVCEPIEVDSCQLAPGDWGYCSDPMCSPCQTGLGDCDGHADCVDGLSCVENAGERHGWSASMDICEAP